MGLLAAWGRRPARRPLPGRRPSVCQLGDRQRHLQPALARGPGPVRVVLRVRQLHLLPQEQAGLLEDPEDQQQQGRGDWPLGDESSMPLFLSSLSSVFEGQPRLSRTEQRLPGDGRPCWQSNALHRAVLPHRDDGLSKRRVSDHVNLLPATAAATNPLPDVFLLFRTRGQSGKPSRADERQHAEGGGDDPACQREEQQSTSRRRGAATSTSPPLPSTHPAEGSCQGPTAGRGHQPLLPPLHPVGENSLFIVLRFIRCPVLDKRVHFLVV